MEEEICSKEENDRGRGESDANQLEMYIHGRQCGFVFDAEYIEKPLSYHALRKSRMPIEANHDERR